MTVSTTTPYWIDVIGLAETAAGGPPRLAVVPCPAGANKLRASLTSLHEQGIDTLVSLLSPEEVKVLGLEAEPEICVELGMSHCWFPVPDHSIPESMEDFRAVLDIMQRDLSAGKGVGAHCFAGIGRSCMLMAGLLCLEGLTAAEAFVRLSVARGMPVPDTWLQSQWVQHFAESLASGDSRP
jgi:protein-tyrosine phosphatase